MFLWIENLNLFLSNSYLLFIAYWLINNDSNLNGNLIEVDSAAYDTGNVDMTGNTITSISVLPRTSNDVYTYEITSTNQTLPTQSTTLNDSYTSMVYRIESDSTDKYTVFYIQFTLLYIKFTVVYTKFTRIYIKFTIFDVHLHKCILNL